MWKREKNDRDNRIVIPISFQLQWPAQEEEEEDEEAKASSGLWAHLHHNRTCWSGGIISISEHAEARGEKSKKPKKERKKE